MLCGKVACSKSTGSSFLIMLARASADVQWISELHLFNCSIICLVNWTPACSIQTKAESWGKYFIPFDLMS